MNAAWGAPISFNSAIGLAENEFVLREQYVLDQSAADPSGAERERKAQALISVLGYGINSNLVLFGVLPYFDNRFDSGPQSARQTRSIHGIADPGLFARYTLYRRDGSGRTLRISPFAGLDIPMSEDNEQDSRGKIPANIQTGSGSWDPFVGVVLTYQTLDFEVDTALSYQENTQAHQFESGDILRFDASFQYRLWPKQLQHGVPGFLYAVFESNIVYQTENRIATGKDPDSGGTRVLLVPGLQFVTRRWVIEAAVQLPVIQHMNGRALKNEYIFRAGFRVNF